MKCTLLARELERVISSYEALSEAERSRVPATMSWKSESFVANDMNHTDKIIAAK